MPATQTRTMRRTTPASPHLAAFAVASPSVSRSTLESLAPTCTQAGRSGRCAEDVSRGRSGRIRAFRAHPNSRHRHPISLVSIAAGVRPLGPRNRRRSRTGGHQVGMYGHGACKRFPPSFNRSVTLSHARSDCGMPQSSPSSAPRYPFGDPGNVLLATIVFATSQLWGAKCSLQLGSLSYSWAASAHHGQARKHRNSTWGAWKRSAQSLLHSSKSTT